MKHFQKTRPACYVFFITSMELEMMMSDELMSTWTELPFDLLSLIFDKVMSFSLSDYVRISAVCLEWRSFFLAENYEPIKLPNKLPVLLLPSSHPHLITTKDMNNNLQQEEQQQQQNQEEEGEFFYNRYDYYNPRDIWLGLNHKQRHQSTRSFYNILEKKIYDFQLPIPSYLNCRGSSHGWLVLVEECCDRSWTPTTGTYPVHLLNPFRPDNNKVHLPPLTSSDPRDEVYHSYYLDKAILSADPSSSLVKSNPTTTTDNELVVLGMTGIGYLRFCRPGDKEWTRLTGLNYGSAVLNLTCYRGQFWIILQNGGAMAFDISPLLPKPNVTTIIDPPQDDDDPHSMSRYLVESAGNLFQVRRDIIFLGDNDDGEDCRYSTAGFYVFKLDWVLMEWVKTNCLDGHIFFLGNNEPISISASDYYFSGGGGVGSCKPNSIYFTDDYVDGYGSRPGTGTDGPHDMGVFNLDDGSFERFEPYYTVDSRNIMPAPIWIQPML